MTTSVYIRYPGVVGPDRVGTGGDRVCCYLGADLRSNYGRTLNDVGTIPPTNSFYLH